MSNDRKKHGTCRYLSQQGIIHCEVEGAVININEGLHDVRGRKVTSVQIHPDNFAGERGWKVLPRVHNVRIIEVG